jgi:aquaporin related protein
MNDAAVVHLPNYSRRDSRDILFRPPVQPNEAYLKHGEIASPPGPNTGILPATDTFGISSENPRTTPKRLIGDGGRYLAYPSGEREWEQDNRENRTRPRLRYQLSNSEYRGEYIEERGYEDYDQPRVYRRPSRRANTRPPPAHQNFSSGQGRYSRDQPRSSYDFPRPSMDYEPDTPTKPHTQQYYSEDEEALRGVRYPRGPPRRPPATEEVLRLPWTMWMNSNAKNRMCPNQHPPLSFVPSFLSAC